MDEDTEIKSEEKKVNGLKTFLNKIPLEKVLRWGMFALAVIALVLLFPTGTIQEFSSLKLNFISPVEIIAPFDFELLKTDTELENERKDARMAVMPVFRRIEETGNRRLALLDTLITEIEDILFNNGGLAKLDSAKLAEIDFMSKKYRIDFTTDLIKKPAGELTQEWWKPLTERLKTDLERIYRLGVLNNENEASNTTAEAINVITKGVERRASIYSVYSLNLAKSVILENLKNEFPEGDTRIKLGYEIVLNIIEPNLIFDAGVTKKRRDEATAKIALAKGIVLKDERIIDSNERVTQEHLDKLRSLALKKKEMTAQEGGLAKVFPFVGKTLFSGGILLVFGFLVFIYKPEIATNKNFLLILLILLSHLAFLQLILTKAGISSILFPSALAAMLITVFFGYQVGFWFLGMLMLLAGAMQGNDFQLALMTLVVGSVAIVSIKNIRSRTRILTSALYLVVTYIVFLAGFHFIQSSISTELLRQIGLASLNSVMTPIFVLGFAIILGNLFDITTDLTLLELSDLNRPLLKKLAAAAPGTYHHSLMVGNLAEAAAEAIRANPLLARTASYYHDIGKIEYRDYFVENQVVFNPHDTIKPEESAEVLNSHVLNGLELAEKHRLPQVIKDVITQHHGTSVMQYFYHKALKNSLDKKNITIETFKYSGPIPVSRESGIIMLADSVEAAIRSLGEATPAEIRDKVKSLIDARIQDGQLDNCELSIHDLQIITESFVTTLRAHAHHRIAYPTREEIEKETASAKADIN